MTSMLTLNNNKNEATDVKITIFNSKGEPFRLAPISLASQQVSRFSMRELTKDARGDFKSGNIQVFYHGPAMGVTGQVSITSIKDRLSFESSPTEAMMFASTTLDGIVWVPDEKTKASVALTNTASSPITVTASSGRSSQGRQKALTLGPRETQVLELREFVEVRKDEGAAALVILTHSGAAGDLITTGFALNDKTGFACSVNFVDRSRTKSNRLAGAHLRFGPAHPEEGFPSGTTFQSTLVIANAGSLPTEVKIAVDYTVNTVARRVELTPITLAAQEIKQIDLAQEVLRRGVVGFVDNAGVDIYYTGAAGSVLGRLTSIDTTGDFSFEVPIKDPLAGMNRVGGSYPWRLDQGYNTVLHLKNTIDKEVSAIVQVRYKGGTYNPKLIKLAPYQTVALDIRRMKDEQQKDIRGGVMPKDATSGQVVWYEQTVGSLIGRAEVINVGIGVAGSFSCPTGCPCPPNHSSTYMSPSSLTSVVNDVGSPFLPMEMRQSCDGVPFGPYDMSFQSTWSSTNTNVATTQGAVVTCVGIGSAGIQANYPYTYFYYDFSLEYCFELSNSDTAQGTLQVVDFTLTFSQNDIYPTGTGGSSTSTVTVQTNPATQGLSVNLSLNEIIGSGGHVNHSGTRPVGTLSATQGTTGSGGAFQATYTSSIFGGAVTIFASVATTNVNKSEIMRVGVPSLSSLGAGNYYTLTGALPQHPVNHYGTNMAITNLPLIASDYRAAYPTAANLPYNDISLINGGKFEIPGNWSATADHQEHRMGRNCDINYGSGQAIATVEQQATFESILVFRNSSNYLKHVTAPLHYHTRFDQ